MDWEAQAKALVFALIVALIFAIIFLRGWAGV